MPSLKKKPSVNLKVADATKKEEREPAEKKPVLRNREDCSVFDKLFYNYAKPIHDVAQSDENLSAEMYPEVHESRSMRANADRIEKFMQEYILKNPNDRLAMAKAVFFCSKGDYLKFLAVRIFNSFVDIYKTYIYLELI